MGATAFVPDKPDMYPGWEDSAVPPEKVGDYLKDLRDLFTKYGYNPSLYGHFGQGCIHCRVSFDMKTEEGLEKYKKFTDGSCRDWLSAMVAHFPVNMVTDNPGVVYFR